MAQVCIACQTSNPDSAELCENCGTPFPGAGWSAPTSTPADGMRVSSDKPAGGLKPGDMIAERYKVVESIGAGGMGVVYRVHDTVLSEDVALKLMAPRLLQDQTAVQRFLNEARVTRQLTHKNVVRVHDIGRCGDMLYISMEFVRGRSLRKAAADRAAAGQPFSTEEVISIMCQVCDSLEYAHQFTIHRDIKPENVMLTEAGDVKLMDFGLSKLLAAPGLTMTAAVMGTPMYMAPEQFRDSAHVDLRADLFSVGIMLYELLTGQIPTGMARPASQMREGIPPAMDLIVSRCTAPEADQRYSSAGEIRNDLRTALLEMRGEMPVVEQIRDKRRRPVLKAVLALAFVAAVVAGVWAAVAARQRPRLEAEAALDAMNEAIRQTPTGIALERRAQADDVASHARQLNEEERYSEAAEKAGQARRLYLALLPPSADGTSEEDAGPAEQKPEQEQPTPVETPPPTGAVPEQVRVAMANSTTARKQANEADANERVPDLFNRAAGYLDNGDRYRIAREYAKAQEEYEKAEQQFQLAAVEAIAAGKSPKGMVYVPSGTFTMGSAMGAEHEQPETLLYLHGFYIDKYEVSWGDFRKFLERASGTLPPVWQAGAENRQMLNPEHPAIAVTWPAAAAYAESIGKRLPTEAEWEKAARGTEGRTYPWGLDWEDGLCNSLGVQFGQPIPLAPVTAFAQSKSPFGCYNMAGNAIEWVSSLYWPYPYAADDGREDVSVSGDRVMRGGSCYLERPAVSLRTTQRFFANPLSTAMLPGFRCARDAPSSSASMAP